MSGVPYVKTDCTLTFFERNYHVVLFLFWDGLFQIICRMCAGRQCLAGKVIFGTRFQSMNPSAAISLAVGTDLIMPWYCAFVSISPQIHLVITASFTDR